jgi:peptidoglycan DL-endopeptidase CwlO
MKSLDSLFADAETQPVARPRTDALSRLVGDATVEVAAAPSADARRLRALVGDPVPAMNDAPMAPVELARPGRRPLRFRRVGDPRRDWISRGVAVVAVLAVVGIVGVAGYQQLSRNPADEVAANLREQEAELQNAALTLDTSTALLESTVEAAEARVTTITPALTTLADKTDASVWQPAEAARAALAVAVDDTAVPALPEAYERPSVDVSTLEGVARALDVVTASQLAIDELLAQVRAERGRLAAAVERFDEAVSGLGATVPDAAELAVAENSLASATFRDAVTTAAERVVADQRTGDLGVNALLAYAAAVDALRAEHTRVDNLPQTAPSPAPVRPPSRGTVTPVAPASPAPSQPAPPAEPAPEQPAPEQPAPEEPAPGGTTAP